MIKIIEKGKETFELTCARCGCKFSYDAEDAHGTYTDEMKVECPQCKFNNTHPRQDETAKKIEITGNDANTSNKSVDGENYTDILTKLLRQPFQTEPYPAYLKTNDCSECQFYKNVLLSDKPYIGDSPCDWCYKRQVTCNSLNSTCVAAQKRDYELKATNEVKEK